jgi:thiamine monophosphate synthase
MRLLAITPPASLVPHLDPGVVDAWIRGGADELGIAVLLREPGAPLEAILADSRFVELRIALAERGIPTLVSADADALDRGAAAVVLDARPALAGVQLRGDPSAAVTQRWRERLGSLVIGRSCHGVTPDPAVHAVDYTCVAPVFAPRTAQRGVDKQPIGRDALARWAAVVPRVFALGGVDLGTAQACLAAGAVGLAGISLFFGQIAAAQQNVAALRRLFDHVPQPRQRR